MPAGNVDEVRRLVLLTAGHTATADDRNGAVLCDADLAILAAVPDAYDDYAVRVRAEYAHVPDELFRVGRATVLRQLLELPALFRRHARVGATGPRQPRARAGRSQLTPARRSDGHDRHTCLGRRSPARCSSRTISRLDTTVAPSHTAIANRSAGRS